MRHGTEARGVVADAEVLHPEQWWAEFPRLSERFEPAFVVDGIGDLVIPRITNPLLRRETEIAAATVTRHLARPSSPELAEQAAEAAERLVATVERISERTANLDAAVELAAMCHAVCGRYAAAAAAAETCVGTKRLLRLFLSAMRMDRFDIQLASRLLDAGRAPTEAIRSGALVGRYRYWPTWLQQVLTARALAGTLDDATITALDNCAYASLSPIQANFAGKLLRGDAALIGNAVRHLEGLGELDAAQRLREGDLNAVALATRLMSM